MHLTHLSLLAILAGASAQGNSTAFPPGWNHLAKSPPMGWRSWNAFGANINDKTFRNAIDAVTAKVWDVGGAKASLFEVGYTRVGIDEGWENCSGTDPDHGLRQHNADGTPMINVDKFPDLKGLVDYGHSKGVLMGWYLNGCACGEHVELAKNYKGDIQSLHDFGFDGVKIDGCGAQRNQTFYAALMRGTGRAYTIENCHWGRCTQGDDSSCPTRDWCPLPCYAHDYTRCELGLLPLTYTTLVQVPVQLVPHLGRHQRGRGELVPKPADDDQVPGLRGAAQPARLLGALPAG